MQVLRWAIAHRSAFDIIARHHTHAKARIISHRILRRLKQYTAHCKFPVIAELEQTKRLNSDCTREEPQKTRHSARAKLIVLVDIHALLRRWIANVIVKNDLLLLFRVIAHRRAYGFNVD